MLDPAVQDRLIEAIQNNATHWHDSGPHTLLRTLKVGPGRRHVITIQDGEFTDGGDVAQRVLIKSLTDVQQAEKTEGWLTYKSLRSQQWVQVPLDTLQKLRAATAPEAYRNPPPNDLVLYGLVSVETLGGGTITRITPEGKDALRLFLFM